MMSDTSKFANIWYGGVDFSLPGNGGHLCFEYLGIKHRLMETILITVISCLEIYFALKFIRDCENVQQTKNHRQRNGSALSSQIHSRPFFQMPLLVCMSLAFGIEIGYKLCKNEMIFLLNPCHVLTVSQIYLLCVDNTQHSRTAQTVFRVHLHLLSGALLALLFPVTNTRHFPFEEESYWLHHILLYATPIYLLACGGNFTPEPLTDIWWPILSIGAGFLYHFIVLQGLAMVTEVNLNSMLCPALSDPFEGKYYRLWALAHQHALITIHGKLYQISSHIIRGVVRRLGYIKLWFYYPRPSSDAPDKKSL